MKYTLLALGLFLLIPGVRAQSRPSPVRGDVATSEERPATTVRRESDEKRVAKRERSRRRRARRSYRHFGFPHHHGFIHRHKFRTRALSRRVSRSPSVRRTGYDSRQQFGRRFHGPETGRTKVARGAR